MLPQAKTAFRLSPSSNRIFMNQIVINADLGKARISRHIYGHFAEHLGRCIYGGLWVGEDSPIPNTRGVRDDVIAALRAVRIPNLRWPGGCFADEYHWMDGIGPRAQRPTMINTHWGGVTENNHFGAHEFLDLCEQLGCEPYICGNVGSGSIQEMQQWVEYLTFDGTSPMADLRARNGHAAPWRVSVWDRIPTRRVHAYRRGSLVTLPVILSDWLRRRVVFDDRLAQQSHGGFRVLAIGHHLENRHAAIRDDDRLAGAFDLTEQLERACFEAGFGDCR